MALIVQKDQSLLSDVLVDLTVLPKFPLLLHAHLGSIVPVKQSTTSNVRQEPTVPQTPLLLFLVQVEPLALEVQLTVIQL